MLLLFHSFHCVFTSQTIEKKIIIHNSDNIVDSMLLLFLVLKILACLMILMCFCELFSGRILSLQNIRWIEENLGDNELNETEYHIIDNTITV